jgi:DNA-binding response OmpR family regulator
VVEDDEDCRWVVMRALMKVDFQCEAARDGEHALQLLHASPFKIVVTDLRMPKKHGFSLAAEIQTVFGKAAPGVVIYTGIEEPKLVGQLFALGVEDVCIKPMNPDILAAKVLAVYHRRAQGKIALATEDEAQALQNLESSPKLHSSGPTKDHRKKQAARDQKIIKLAAS